MQLQQGQRAVDDRTDLYIAVTGKLRVLIRRRDRRPGVVGLLNNEAWYSVKVDIIQKRLRAIAFRKQLFIEGMQQFKSCLFTVMCDYILIGLGKLWPFQRQFEFLPV